MIEYIMKRSSYERWAKEARKRLPANCGLEPENILVFVGDEYVEIIAVGDNIAMAEAYIEAITDDGFEVIKKG